MDDRKDNDGGAFSVIDKRPVFADDGAAPPPAPRDPSVVAELRARAEEAEKRAREISAAYRKIEEEREAFRERLARDLDRRLDIARADLMRKVIGVVDDLDRAIAAARGSRDPAPLLAGVAIIRDRLLQILASEGVEMVVTADRPFDPGVAEAVIAEETDDPARNNVVLEEMEKGYTLRGTLLRPARVKVGRARSPVGGQAPS